MVNETLMPQKLPCSVGKEKYLATTALEIAEQIIRAMAPGCDRIQFAGSLRRRRKEVGDIEILYVPKMWAGGIKAIDLFGTPPDPTPLADIEIGRLENNGTLERRKNIKGNEAFGDHIKLMRHCASGIPVDLFATTGESWFNYLVCRTGGAASNICIAGLAKARGYKWKPYTAGFIDLNDPDERVIPMGSEEEVFRFVGLKYEEPWNRP